MSFLGIPDSIIDDTGKGALAGGAGGGWIGALVGGGLGLAGGLIGNQANASEANKTRDWQEWMAEHRHAMEVQDLKNSGLNPILSANAGASAPGGAQANMQNPIAPAIAAAQQVTQMNQAQSQIALNAAQATAAASAAQRDTASARQVNNTAKMQEYSMEAFRRETKGREDQAYFDNNLRTIKNVNNMVNGVLGTANSAKDLLSPVPQIKTPNSWQQIPRGGSIYNPETGEYISPPPWR